MKILITAAVTTAAHQLKKRLNQPETLLGDYAELPAIMLRSGSMINLPNPADASYAHKMLTLCLDNNIITVYALKAAELILLNEANLLFMEYGIIIMPGTNEV